MVVLNSSFIYLRRLSKSSVLLESKAPVGSSANIIEGKLINALAAEVR